MQPVCDGPLLARIIDGDVFLISLCIFLDMLFLIPDNLADVGWISQNLRHTAPGKCCGAMGPRAHGIDLSSYYGAPITVDVHIKHHADKPRLWLIRLQGWAAVNGGLLIPIGSVGHITAVLDRLPQPAPQAFVDDLVLPAADECFKLRQLVVNLIGKIIYLVWRNNQRPAVLECVQNNSLVPHTAAG